MKLLRLRMTWMTTYLKLHQWIPLKCKEEGNINSEALAYGISLDDCKLSDVESVGSAQDPTDTSSMGDSPGYSSGIDSEASSDIQEDTVMEEEVLEQQFEGFHQALF